VEVSVPVNVGVLAGVKVGVAVGRATVKTLEATWAPVTTITFPAVVPFPNTSELFTIVSE
jgi:hypothetical protein